jgi:hypothetical protein
VLQREQGDRGSGRGTGGPDGLQPAGASAAEHTQGGSDEALESLGEESSEIEHRHLSVMRLDIAQRRDATRSGAAVPALRAAAQVEAKSGV